MLWIDLEQPDGKRSGEVPQLEHRDGRYELAAAQLDPPTTEGHFKNHLRRPLLERVGEEIRSLLTDFRNAPSSTTPSTPEDLGSDFNYPLNEIAKRSIDLYYAAVSTLCVAEFDSHLWDGSFAASYHPEHSLVWLAWAKRFHRQYMLFATELAFLDDPSVHKERLQDLSADINSRIDALCRVCVKCGPPGLAKLSNDELLEMWVTIEPDTDDDAESRFITMWLPWYERAFPINREEDGHFDFDQPTRQSVKDMAAHALAIYDLIGPRIDLEEPFKSNARRRAYKDIESSYLFEDRPLHGGRYFRERIDLCFEDTKFSLPRPT
jgi:hypothetical protein